MKYIIIFTSLTTDLDGREVLELPVRVVDGPHQREVRRLVDPQLTVLVCGQQLVSRLRGEVSAVDCLVVVELGQGGLLALYVPDVPHLDGARARPCAGGDHHPGLSLGELHEVTLGLVQFLVPDLLPLQSHQGDDALVVAGHHGPGGEGDVQPSVPSLPVIGLCQS